jgi:Periplasmic binding protein-like domain
MDKFGPVPIDAIDFALADELVIELCEKRAAIETAAANGTPLKRTIKSDSGRTYEAHELRVSDTLIRRVRRRETWNDQPARRNRNDVPRRVIAQTLILARPRVSELCGLDGSHVDLGAARIRIPRSATKPDAGERSVPIVPSLATRLSNHFAEFPSGPGQPAFPTRNGTRHGPDNLRARILMLLRGRSNELLEADGRLPIAHTTPHAAAHVRIDPRRLRRSAAEGHVPDGAHGSVAHARRLPAGAGHGEGIHRATRGDPRLQARRGAGNPQRRAERTSVDPHRPQSAGRAVLVVSCSQAAYEAVTSLLELDALPHALFVSNNLMVLGALRAARDGGLRVPDDLAVVGIDDPEWAAP